MIIGIIGSGGREHAICAKILESKKVNQVYCFPGNAGTNLIAKNVEVSFLENKDAFSNVEWENLYKLSEDTFVEERDSLKQGSAGAGLTDND